MTRFAMNTALVSLSILFAVTAESQAPPSPQATATFDEMLVLGGDEPTWTTALVRAGEGAWQRCGVEGDSTRLAHRTLVRGVIHLHTAPGALHPETRTCTVATTREVIAPSTHALFPIDAQHFGPIETPEAPSADSLMPFATQHLEVHHAENDRVQWAALWASDLPASIVLEGRPTMRSAELVALLEEAMRTTRGHEVGREELFRPEIPHRAQRLAIAHTRTYRAPEAHLEVVALCRGHQRDLRIVHFALARDSTRHAWWRGVIRSAVLNHGARPWEASHPGCE